MHACALPAFPHLVSRLFSWGIVLIDRMRSVVICASGRRSIGMAALLQTADKTTFAIYPDKSEIISPYWREKYETEARKYWDIFYKKNADRFFKDRHYLDKEWGCHFTNFEMQSENPVAKKVLEVGCGVGNTIFPLLFEYPHIFVYACDFSPRAVNIVKENKEYVEARVHAFICDVTSEELNMEISPSSIDIVMLIFTLSAISPEKMPFVLQNIKKVMKQGGCVLLRDYAAGDLAEERLKKRPQKISDNYFVRGDGTRAFYFSETYLENLFLNEGFTTKSIHVYCRDIENRARGIVMHRRWIQGVFCLDGECNTEDSLDLKLRAAVSVEKESNNSGNPTEGRSDSGYDGDLSISDMFNSLPILEDLLVPIDKYLIEVKSLSKENQHVIESTGLILWESALLFSHVLVRTEFLKSKNVLELGCGATGICSLIASLTAEKVVATDGDPTSLNMLENNLRANEHLFPLHKISCLRLRWDNVDDIHSIKATNRDGFNVIFGTDVTYAETAMYPLFQTARNLLAKHVVGEPEPLLVLCHMTRRVSEPEIVIAAGKCGFVLTYTWSSGMPYEELCIALGSLNIDKDASSLTFSNLIHLLCFTRKT